MNAYDKLKELYDMFDMSYWNLVEHLKKKYGDVPYDYFTKHGYVNAKNKKDYLEIHHTLEWEKDIYRTLKRFGSNPYTNEYFHQKQYLVYCNHIEHVLLHLKIYIEKGKGFKTIAKYMIPRIIDYLSGAPHEYFASWDILHLHGTHIYYEDLWTYFVHVLIFLFQQTIIVPDDFKLSYLQEYGSERFKNGVKIHAINDWTFEKNKEIYQKIVNISKNSL